MDDIDINKSLTQNKMVFINEISPWKQRFHLLRIATICIFFSVIGNVSINLNESDSSAMSFIIFLLVLWFSFEVFSFINLRKFKELKLPLTKEEIRKVFWQVACENHFEIRINKPEYIRGCWAEDEITLLFFDNKVLINIIKSTTPFSRGVRYSTLFSIYFLKARVNDVLARKHSNIRI